MASSTFDVELKELSELCCDVCSKTVEVVSEEILDGNAYEGDEVLMMDQDWEDWDNWD